MSLRLAFCSCLVWVVRGTIEDDEAHLAPKQPEMSAVNYETGELYWTDPGIVLPAMQDRARMNDLEGLKKVWLEEEKNWKDDGYKWTPLHAAAIAGAEDTFDWILSQNVTTDGEDFRKNTPFLSAVMEGHLSIAKKILAYNESIGLPIDIHYKQNGMAAYHKACMGHHPRHTEVVRWLLKDMNVDPADLTYGPDFAFFKEHPKGVTCAHFTPNNHTKNLVIARIKKKMAREEITIARGGKGGKGAPAPPEEPAPPARPPPKEEESAEPWSGPDGDFEYKSAEEEVDEDEEPKKTEKTEL